MDPDKIQRDKKFGSSFKVEVLFRKVCGHCQPSMQPQQLCSYCQTCLKNSDMPFWIIIKDILDVKQTTVHYLKAHDFPDHQKGVLLNFNSTVCDYQSKLQEASKLSLRPGEHEVDSEDDNACLMTVQDDFIVVDLRNPEVSIIIDNDKGGKQVSIKEKTII